MKYLRGIGIIVLFWLVFGTVLMIILPWNIANGSSTAYVSRTSIWPGLMLFVGVVIAVRDHRQRNRASGASRSIAVDALGPMVQNDTVATLQGLADLRDRGAISAEEYEAKKAERVARL